MKKPKTVEEVRKDLARDLSVSKHYPRSHSSTGMMRRYEKGKKEDQNLTPTPGKPSGKP